MSTNYPYATCTICSRLDEYVEIDNAQDPSDTDVSEYFPDEVEEFQVPNEPLARYYQFKNERLLKCAHCGTYYWYREWAPGGSEDVLHTTIHESIRRLGFLEAHVELHDALFQANKRAQELGEIGADDLASTRQGVEAEMQALRARHAEIVSEAIQAIEHKYERSKQIAETLKLYAPHRDHSRQLEEERARDQEIAAYHAGILAEYLPYWAQNSISTELIHRLVNLLADDAPTVRAIVKDALLRSLRDGTGQGRLDREIAAAAEQLMPRYTEAEALLEAYAKTGSADWQANRKQTFGSPKRMTKKGSPPKS